MKKTTAIILAAAAILAAGCAKAKPVESAAAQKPEPVLPLAENTTGKTLIQTVSGSSAYPLNSYVITSSKGETVVVDPTEMPPRSLVELNPALIASTHGHMDHVDMKYTDSYSCPKISYFETDMKTRDFHVYSILSGHNGNTPGRSNVIVVFEVDGLRIAHLGDLGQDSFTKEQLKALGKIDIAFMQFVNSYSSMTLENKKGFNLMDELKPTVIIPTHFIDQALPVFNEKYGDIAEYTNALSVSRADLPAKPMTMWRILNTHRYL